MAQSESDISITSVSMCYFVWAGSGLVGDSVPYLPNKVGLISLG